MIKHEFCLVVKFLFYPRDGAHYFKIRFIQICLPRLIAVRKVIWPVFDFNWHVLVFIKFWFRYLEECLDIFIDNLEIAVHQILYARKLYPVQVFQKTQKYNVVVYVSIPLDFLLMYLI